MPCAIDDVEFIETIRQFRCFAHVVDRLPDIPVRRHGDKFGLHPPAGEVFRIFEAAGERDALGGGNCSRISAWSPSAGLPGWSTASSVSSSLTPSATASRRQLVENFLAHSVIYFGECCEVEIDAQQFDEPLTLLGWKASISAPMSDSCRLPTSAFNPARRPPRSCARRS